MDIEQNVGGRDRLARAVLAVVLTIVTIRALKRGKTMIGLLAGLGALGFGFNATTCFCGLNETLEIDTTSE
ncbi:YgaP-like transmembrane domain [Salinirussus salinus]|uniref:YgaP-like transmembrane domain n=1 Tax=Salinirussus salinus TaxID=1198300 RepID=UPI00135A317A|nr:YgaP-like transmembrane domain [Salinirussus salinus]